MSICRLRVADCEILIDYFSLRFGFLGRISSYIKLNLTQDSSCIRLQHEWYLCNSLIVSAGQKRGCKLVSNE